MKFRTYLSFVVFLALLIWGPVNDSEDNWLQIRIAYLIISPSIVYFSVRALESKVLWSENIETILIRFLNLILGLGLLIAAGMAATADSHMRSAEYVPTADGVEAVGDYTIIMGPDWGIVFVNGLFSFIFLYFGVFGYHKIKQ